MAGSPVFVLIHGGQVGGWVWDAVRSRLAQPSVAIELPGRGPDARSLKGLTVARCVDAVLERLPADGAVILVGHSLGAAIALSVASRVRERIAHVVLIAGMVPRPGQPLLDAFPAAMRLLGRWLLKCTPEFAQPPGFVKTRLLNGLPPAQAEQAAGRFGKESSALFFDPVPWIVDPATPVTYVRCLRDRGALSPVFQTQLAARLGADAWVTTLDACHYAMLEKPDDVARLLNAIASFPAGAPWTAPPG